MLALRSRRSPGGDGSYAVHPTQFRPRILAPMFNWLIRSVERPALSRELATLADGSTGGASSSPRAAHPPRLGRQHGTVARQSVLENHWRRSTGALEIDRICVTRGQAHCPAQGLSPSDERRGGRFRVGQRGNRCVSEFKRISASLMAGPGRLTPGRKSGRSRAWKGSSVNLMRLEKSGDAPFTRLLCDVGRTISIARRSGLMARSRWCQGVRTRSHEAKRPSCGPGPSSPCGHCFGAGNKRTIERHGFTSQRTGNEVSEATIPEVTSHCVQLAEPAS